MKTFTTLRAATIENSVNITHFIKELEGMLQKAREMETVQTAAYDMIAATDAHIEQLEEKAKAYDAMVATQHEENSQEALGTPF